jgi:hypothetical protein
MNFVREKMLKKFKRCVDDSETFVMLEWMIIFARACGLSASRVAVVFGRFLSVEITRWLNELIWKLNSIFWREEDNRVERARNGAKSFIVVRFSCRRVIIKLPRPPSHRHHRVQHRVSVWLVFCPFWREKGMSFNWRDHRRG